MPDLLIDSTIVIDALRNHPKALTYLSGLVLAERALTHGIVVAEVIEGTLDAKDLFRTRRFLRKFAVNWASEADSEDAVERLSQVHLSHNVGYADCLIATTALRLGFGVATINEHDFRLFKGLVVERPY